MHMITLHIPAHPKLSPAQQNTRVLESENAAREADHCRWEIRSLKRGNPRHATVRQQLTEEAAMWRELSLWLQSTADAGRTWQV
jgi:hypothetical protein